MELSNGEVSYVSRRYVSKMKKILGLGGVENEKRVIIPRPGGALGGIVISYFIEIGVSIAIGDGNFYPCVPGLAERYGSEITAVIIQTLLSVLLGMGFAGASYIWDRDDWSLLKQTGIYFAVVTILMMTISYVCEWMEHSVKGFVSYFAIFLAIFVAVWIIRYSFWKLRIAKIKGKILESK